MSSVPTKSQILWQCRRGMLELDFFFERFVNEKFDTLSDEDKKQFSELLKYEDPILYQWLLAAEQPEDADVLRLIKMIRND